jgi:hypothetical protein
MPQGELPLREERLRKTFFVSVCGLTLPWSRLHRQKKDIKTQKRFFLVFPLSVEVLLETDPYEF